MTRTMDFHHKRPAILRDPNTHANYDKFITRHVTANLSIDFESKRVAGVVSLHLDSTTSNDNTRELLLDTSFLDVQGTIVNGDDSKWELLPRHKAYGNALRILIPEKIANVRGSINVQVNAGSSQRE